jgi:hypothetical protein
MQVFWLGLTRIGIAAAIIAGIWAAFMMLRFFWRLVVLAGLLLLLATFVSLAFSAASAVCENLFALGVVALVAGMLVGLFAENIYRLEGTLIRYRKRSPF